MKIPVVTFPTTSIWVCYTKMADQGIEIVVIQDSDLGLGAQKYFHFSVEESQAGIKIAGRNINICVGPGKSNLPLELRRKAGRILQTRILDWVAMIFSRGSSRSRD